MSEKWKDISGYEALYEVSNEGRVRNSKTKRILKFDTSKNGYKRVTLRKENKPHKFSVHRLVANEFVENPHQLPCVNHKDEDKSNNKAENLEWCTRSYNINYGSRNYKVRSHATPVKQMDFAGNVLAEYVSVDFAAEVMGVSPSNIYKACKGKISYAYGYKWALMSSD